MTSSLQPGARLAPAFRLAVLPLMLFGSLNVQAETDAEQKSVELPKVEVTSGEIDKNGYIELEKQPEVGKLNVPVQDTPYSIEIVDKDFIKDTGAKTIQDALLYSSGVYAGAFGLDTRGDSAKIRGIDPSQYVDGLRQLYGFYNTVRPNVYALESIEVLKGPSSVLYGQGELGGIVNSVSKLPKAEQQGEIWAQYGSLHRKQLAFDVTGPATEDGKLLYRVVGLERDSQTQVDYVDDDGFFIAPSLTWRPTDDTSFTVLFNRQMNKGQVSAQFLPQAGTLDRGPLGYVGSETFVGEPGWDKYDREKTEVTLMFDHSFTDNWSFSTTARYTESSTYTREHYTTAYAQVDPQPNGDMNRVITTADRHTRIFNLDARLQGEFDLGVTNHTVAIGVDRQDAVWETENSGFAASTPLNLYNPVYGNFDPSVLNPTNPNDNQIRQVGFYVADHMEIGPVVISTALRRDWAKNTLLAEVGDNVTSDEDETTGRIGVMYRFENGFSPYASYAEAFTMNLGTSEDSTLKPTTGKQREYGFKYLSDDKTLAITAAYFDILQTNRVQAGDIPDGVEQTGATIDGWELQVNKRWNQFETQFSYTDLNADNGETGERLPYVSEKVASWWNKYYLNSNWRIGAGIRYIGDNVGSDYGNGAGPEVPSETLYDAMIGYSYKNWDFTVDAKNLTDEEYVSWCRGAGRDCGFGERRNVTANAYYHF
jgi:iron complex outermembrane receptor protein